MDDEVQETNLDEVEVDDEGNLSRSSQYDMDKDGVHQPLRSDKEKYAADVHERGDGLSRREREALERRQRDKDGYTGDGTAEESAGMDNLKQNSVRRRHSFTLAVERGDREDEDSDSSGSYLGLEAYPELTSAVAARSFGPPRPADPPSGLGAGHELHDIELSVIDPAASDVHSVERGEQPSHSKRYDRSLCGLVDLSVRFLRNSSPEKLAIFFAIVAIVVGVLLLCGLLPASFVYVEYYELALAKNRITGRVNRNEVYYPGCYLLTPATELIRFQGTAHILDLKEELRTSDRLPFYLGISLQYFIKRDQLGLLHRDYEHNYFDVVKSMVVSTLKNEAGKFSLDNFRLNRSLVEQELKEALSYRLGEWAGLNTDPEGSGEMGSGG
nr:hypothetical protein BaRGS_024522 [Batillaria attramentaria]